MGIIKAVKQAIGGGFADTWQEVIEPNCGAPVRSLGAKKCEYCGSYVEPVNIKVWKLQSFHEVDYNHI